MTRKDPREAVVALGPATSITVSGRVQRGGRLTVFALGRAVEIDVRADETARAVAARLVAALKPQPGTHEPEFASHLPGGDCTAAGGGA